MSALAVAPLTHAAKERFYNLMIDADPLLFQ